MESVRRTLGLPDARLVEALVAAPHVIVDGRNVNRGEELPPAVTRAVTDFARDLAATPFAAPGGHRLAELGLGPREIAAAARAGLLLRVADGVVLLAGADAQAAEVLAGLPQPFTVADARRALATTRRVAVPLPSNCSITVVYPASAQRSSRDVRWRVVAETICGLNDLVHAGSKERIALTLTGDES